MSETLMQSFIAVGNVCINVLCSDMRKCWM